MRLPAGKKAVIYDFDDTLVKTTEFTEAHLKRTCAELGVEISWDGFYSAKHAGHSFPVMVASAVGFDHDQTVLYEYRKTAMNFPYEAVFGGVDYVNELKRHGIIQGIVTNRDRALKKRAEQAGYSELDFYLSPEVKKPHKDAYKEALALLSNMGFEKEDIVCFGDRESDEKVAQANNLDFYYVNPYARTISTVFIEE